MELEAVLQVLCTAIIPSKGLEWEIKGVRDKFEKKERLDNDRSMPIIINSKGYLSSIQKITINWEYIYVCVTDYWMIP